MPGSARKEIVREGEIATYHCWSRCVQRAWLCGEDPYSGQNFDHRRVWIKSLLEYQASIFAVDIGNYSVLSNHQHVICRTRPDIAETWSDEEVAWRWKMAWPRWKGGQWMREPSDEEIQELLARSEHLQTVRRHLSSLSWFMARTKEPISRMANAEANTKGHFYESRFGCRELVDEAGILCCSIYVDLNQLKAGMSESLADSDNSAIQDRIRFWQQCEAEASVQKFHKHKESPDDQLETHQVQQLLADCHLSPIDQHGPLLLPAGSAPPTALRDPDRASGLQTPERLEQDLDEDTAFGKTDANDIQSQESGQLEGSSDRSGTVIGAPRDSQPSPSTSAGQNSASRQRPTRRIHRRLMQRRRARASDNVILPMPLQQYLQIAEWTAQQVLAERAQPPPTDLESVLRQWQVDPDHWYDAVQQFGVWFHHAVGQSANVAEFVARKGQQWIHGIRQCRRVFGREPSDESQGKSDEFT